MKLRLTNFVLFAGLAGLAPAGALMAENSVPTGAVLPESSLRTPNTGPGTYDSTEGTAHAVTPMNDVAGNTTPARGSAQVPNRPMAPVEQGDLTASALAKVHHVNQMEIEMAKLAMEKGASREVRAYAERLMRDHQMSDRKLLSFASSKNIPVENFAVLTAEQQARERAVSDQLHAATGSSFDRLYLQKMAEGHSDSINDLSQAIEQLPDRAERNFLAKIRPIVGQHERLANILLSKKPS